MSPGLCVHLSGPHTHAPSAALGHAAPASVRGGGANYIQGLIICARPLIMTSTLLHACLRGCCRRTLQYVALNFSQGLVLPQKRTHELVDVIEMHASSSDGNHEAVCRFMLSMLTKAVIDGYIRSVSGCAKPTTKQGSIALFIRLDRGGGGAAAADDDGGGVAAGGAGAVSYTHLTLPTKA